VKKDKPERKVSAAVKQKQKVSNEIPDSQEISSQYFPTETNSQPIITDAQPFESYASNTQPIILNAKKTPKKKGRPRGPYKKKIILPKILGNFEMSQIENTQQEKVVSSNSSQSQSQIFTSTQLTDFNNFKTLEIKNQGLNKNKIIQRDSKTNQQLCIRIHQMCEYTHSTKLPSDFWDNLVNHRFWYEDLDNWD
jgi:hypothetical protein